MKKAPHHKRRHVRSKQTTGPDHKGGADHGSTSEASSIR
eukprot:CAMPEP_0204443244 /NCGR_PEP_ID=MMETSP0470-20130426/88755_1 /ASSEMBLY_ACC=CAM_ASM_000385 /TAXON_ID=2969 /ORGANISM="Oxyrrhis marina" /LENGTH=38 /DNA_ID= /DNA_START= /DNA_END= /DNA_ORIENTATION=